jgi:hypothetical protein
VSAAGGLGSLVESADPIQALGLNTKDLIAPLNRQLHDQGKPAVTPEQIQTAVQAAAKSAVRQGRFDRDILISALVQNTALTRADVEDLATQLDQRMGKITERVEKAETSALQAAESTGKGLWWVFGTLLIGLFAAVGGALIKVSPKQRHTGEHERELPREAPLGQPVHV